MSHLQLDGAEGPESGRRARARTEEIQDLTETYGAGGQGGLVAALDVPDCRLRVREGDVEPVGRHVDHGCHTRHPAPHTEFPIVAAPEDRIGVEIGERGSGTDARAVCLVAKAKQ